MTNLRTPLYDLTSAPFEIKPNTGTVWMDGSFGYVYRALKNNITEGKSGLSIVTAPAGNGKTLLAKQLLAHFENDSLNRVWINHPHTEAVPLLKQLLAQLDPADTDPVPTHCEDIAARINDRLLSYYTQRKHTVIFIDKAQNLADETLDWLSQLTPLRANTPRLIHLVLLTTPALDARLHEDALKATRETVTNTYQLHPLTGSQCTAYLRYHMKQAGSKQQLFSRPAMHVIFQASRGRPRLINKIANHALILASVGGAPRVNEKMARRAANEVLPKRSGIGIKYPMSRLLPWIIAGLILIGAGWWATQTQFSTRQVQSLAQKGVSISQQISQLEAALLPPAQARKQAWHKLLALWQVHTHNAPVEQIARCQTNLVPGLYCVSGTGSLSQVTRFNRPVLLDVDTPGGTTPVLLLGVGKQHVRIWINNKPFELSRAAFLRIWHGHFYALYQTPPFVPSLLRSGNKGQAVTWLDNKLRQAGGEPANSYTAQTLFNADVVQRVKQLQKRFSIPADGIVGVETLFALTSLNTSGPHLHAHVP